MEIKHKIKIGNVVSTKMDKTAVVAVELKKRHPLYGKTFKKVIKYKAHDPENQCHLGDRVRIMETRPLSRHKHWRIAEIITREEVADIKPQEINQ